MLVTLTPIPPPPRVFCRESLSQDEPSTAAASERQMRRREDCRAGDRGHGHLGRGVSPGREGPRLAYLPISCVSPGSSWEARRFSRWMAS